MARILWLRLFFPLAKSLFLDRIKPSKDFLHHSGPFRREIKWAGMELAWLEQRSLRPSTQRL